MFLMLKKDKRAAAYEKELRFIAKKEEALRRAAHQEGTARRLDEKIPPKIRIHLNQAFGKAFALLFEKGDVLIGKTMNQEAILNDFDIQDYAIQVKGTRKEMQKLRNKAGLRNLFGLTVTTAEGAALGVLGIGLPDIVIFVALVLKAVYETALHYGYDYTCPEEKMLILKMLQASLSKGADWDRVNNEVDKLLYNDAEPEQEDIVLQMKKTADAFALDMLLLKFIQGIPLIGIVGGTGNLVYYRKILKYVQLKYQKRYLFKAKKGSGYQTAIR